MKEFSNMPVTKIERASKFIKTGVKVGGNYLKHYGKSILQGDHDKTELDENNAKEIYASLSELKGSALKVAQMLAMDRSILPDAYRKQFAQAQYSAPPLSLPLVVRTFQKSLGKSPFDIFDFFSPSAVQAASIGQVHKASIGEIFYAVKIQYPGVANSISSDLKLVKPFALKLFNLSEKDLNQYLGEVESKLIEETNYKLEVKRSQEIATACQHLPGITFPKYYAHLSSESIITMDWMNGKHLTEFIASQPDQTVRNAIGQALWDFYHYQIHHLHKVHADPHPGNFLVDAQHQLVVLDFGCVKEIPDYFYQHYFRLLQRGLLQDDAALMESFYALEFLYEQDTPQEIALYKSLFVEMIGLLGRPFQYDRFDFGDIGYFQSIYDLSDKLTNMKELRQSRNARGSHHCLYINRTYFGLYSILHELKAAIHVTKPDWIQ